MHRLSRGLASHRARRLRARRARDARLHRPRHDRSARRLLVGERRRQPRSGWRGDRGLLLHLDAGRDRGGARQEARGAGRGVVWRQRARRSRRPQHRAPCQRCSGGRAQATSLRAQQAGAGGHRPQDHSILERADDHSPAPLPAPKPWPPAEGAGVRARPLIGNFPANAQSSRIALFGFAAKPILTALLVNAAWGLGTGLFLRFLPGRALHRKPIRFLTLGPDSAIAALEWFPLVATRSHPLKRRVIRVAPLRDQGVAGSNPVSPISNEVQTAFLPRFSIFRASRETFSGVNRG